jgi:hypothetical protein
MEDKRAALDILPAEAVGLMPAFLRFRVLQRLEELELLSELEEEVDVVFEVPHGMYAELQVSVGLDKGVAFLAREVIVLWPTVFGRGAEHSGILFHCRFQWGDS